MDSKTFRRVGLELIVVVFGILIALAADRWNQNRQERATAAKYLEALAEDLAADTAALSALVRLYDDRGMAAYRVLEALEGDAEFGGDPAGLARDINYSGYVTSFAASDFTYRELLSTGGLGLIEDPNLKRALVAYYQRVEFYAQFHPIWKETPLTYYRPEVRARLAPADWSAIEGGGAGAGGEQLDAVATLNALRPDGLIQKLLVSITTTLAQQAASHESLRGEASDLLRLLVVPGR